jgi:hypothetical protein
MARRRRDKQARGRYLAVDVLGEVLSHPVLKRSTGTLQIEQQRGHRFETTSSHASRSPLPTTTPDPSLPTTTLLPTHPA